MASQARIRNLRNVVSILFLYAIATMPLYVIRTYIRVHFTRKRHYAEWKRRLGNDFDYQWKNLPSRAIEYNNDRINEFLAFTGLKPEEMANRVCLDAGCGNGRYTYAMLKLGAATVDSIDISPEAVAKCRAVNPRAQVKSIMELEPDPKYDFVLSWGVLNHVERPREAFSKVASQVAKGGTLHIMVYHKHTQLQYEEGRRLWPTLTEQERESYCRKMIKKYGGDMHGWFDALNPTYNWAFTECEVEKWFEEEGFSEIHLVQKYNINMNGRRLD